MQPSNQKSLKLAYTCSKTLNKTGVMVLVQTIVWSKHFSKLCTAGFVNLVTHKRYYLERGVSTWGLKGCTKTLRTNGDIPKMDKGFTRNKRCVEHTKGRLGGCRKGFLADSRE